jgi:hypothetical protein
MTNHFYCGGEERVLRGLVMGFYCEGEESSSSGVLTITII